MRRQSAQITDKINFLKDKRLLGQKGNSPPYHEEGKSIQTEEEAAKEPLSNIASIWAENDTVPSTYSLGNLHDERPDLPVHQLREKSQPGPAQPRLSRRSAEL